MSFHWNLQHALDAQTTASSIVDSHHGSTTIRVNESRGAPSARDITISLVDDEEDRLAACGLVNARYDWRGYGSSHSIQSGSFRSTFNAEVDGRLVATITLAVDSPSGMAVDAAFGDELKSFRETPASKLCELTKFAIDASMQSKELMATLFHTVFIYGHRTHACTDLFIEVHPRHVRFYEAMLGFRKVGDVKTNESVDAPAQLMWLKVSDIRGAIAGGNVQHGSRSLYPLFFSAEEEDGIYRRLVRGKQPHAPHASLPTALAA
jgi:hypothetical protein